MAEEVRNPSVELPTAIVWSVPMCCVFGLGFLLPIVSTLPDMSTLLQGKWFVAHIPVTLLFKPFQQCLDNPLD
jgi:hypothetical protein